MLSRVYRGRLLRVGSGLLVPPSAPPASSPRPGRAGGRSKSPSVVFRERGAAPGLVSRSGRDARVERGFLKAKRVPSFFRSVRGTGVVPPSAAGSSSGAQLWGQLAVSGKAHGAFHSLPPLAIAPYSQAILMDQPFGEEFLHALVHTGTEPIPFLRQGRGHLRNTTGLRLQAECNCDFSPPSLSNGRLWATPGLGSCSDPIGLLTQALPLCSWWAEMLVSRTPLACSWPWT